MQSVVRWHAGTTLQKPKPSRQYGSKAVQSTFLGGSFTRTVSSAIARFSLTRIDYNAIDESLKTLCITRTFTYACLILHGLSKKCEDKRLDDGPIFSDLAQFLLRDFL
jgi:hypothetical protein